jgi:hypothetical protein
VYITGRDSAGRAVLVMKVEGKCCAFCV